MLIHHGARATYDEAASAAAASARPKLEAMIERGRTKAGEVLAAIDRDVPTDHVAPAPRFRFAPDAGAVRLALDGWDAPAGLHEHALRQAAERVELPWPYVQTLRARNGWGSELLADNLSRLFEHSSSRFLVRSYSTPQGREVRGILSDRFRRLDSRPIVESFARACQTLGVLPFEGHALETKIEIKAILPRVFEPVPHEVMAFGVSLSNSDVGDGALSVRAFLARLWCTNLAVMQEELRQVHLGGRLPDDVVFSDHTYRLDSDRSSSMVRDLVGNLLGPARVGSVLEGIRAANAAGVSAASVKGFLEKHANKGEAKAITEAFASAEVEMLPPGMTAWRLSNAVSWIAGKTEDTHRRLELEKVAGLALAAA